jgi:hypothetical protein
MPGSDYLAADRLVAQPRPPAREEGPRQQPGNSTHPRARDKRYGILISALLLAALYIYARDLGGKSFSIDELYQFYAADSFNQNGILALPSGRLYERAVLYTHAVSLSLKSFEVSEWSARLPSVFFSLLYLLCFYAVVAKLFNPPVAILSAILILFSPLQVYYSRECRFYSLFQLTYLIQAFLGLLLLSASRSLSSLFTPPLRLTGVRNTCIVAGAFAVTTWISWSLSPLSWMLFPSVVVFIFSLLGDRFLEERNWNLVQRFVLMLGLFCVTALLFYFLRSALGHLLGSMTYVPPWASYYANDQVFYLRVLKRQSFLLCLLIPIGAYLALRENRFSAYYIAALFLTSFTIQSFLPMKQDRFLYQVLPFAAVFIAISLWSTLRALMNFSRTATRRWKSVTALLAVSSLIGFMGMNNYYTYAHPWIDAPVTPRWRESLSLLKTNMRSDDVVVTDNPIAVRYYLGRVDYVIDENLLSISQQVGYRNKQGKWLDYYTSAEHITGPEELATLIASGRHIWIFLGHEGSGFKEFRALLSKMATPSKHASYDERIKIFEAGE